MSRTRVVVTGMGTTSPLGGDVASTWDGMLAGRSGVRALTEEWAEELPVKIAGRVAVEPTEVLERVKARRLDRSSQFAMVAAMEAWRDCRPRGAATSTASGSAWRWPPASAASTRCSTTTTCSRRRDRAGSPRSRSRC